MVLVHNLVDLFAGAAVDSLAVDHQRLYWSNEKEKVLYSVDKRSGQGLVRDEVGDIKQIIAYGSHLQPLPGMLQLFACN